MLLGLIQEGQEKSVVRDLPAENIVALLYCTIDGLFIQSRYYTKDEFSKKAEAVGQMFWQAIKA